MTNLPNIDLLAQTHDFPCAYMFKVIGHARNGFLARVVAAVREELAIEDDPPYHLRETPAGQYVSVTLEPLVQSPEKVLEIYRRLISLSDLVMLW